MKISKGELAVCVSAISIIFGWYVCWFTAKDRKIESKNIIEPIYQIKKVGSKSDTIFIYVKKD